MKGLDDATFDNTAYTLWAYTLALSFDRFRTGGTLLSSVTASYMLKPLGEMPGNKGR